jgi:hypothetical protein
VRRVFRERTVDPRADLAFRLTAWSYVGFSLIDCVTTAEALARGLHERNPVAAALYAHFGIASLFVLKVAIVATIVTVLALMPRRVAVWVSLAFAGAVAAAVIDNLHALLRLH